MADSSLENIAQMVTQVSGLIANYASRAGRVNESNTIRALVTPMISALGWDINDLDEVQSEYRHASNDNPVDYALFHDGAPSLFIEAKALDGKLDDRKWIIQTLNYANACNVEWAVLTNGAEWRVYNVHAKVEAEDKLFYTVHIDDGDPQEAARRLAMLAKCSMAPKRALDQAWREAAVDRSMRRVIEELPDNKAAVRAMARASNGLSEKDVRDALRRLGLRADWRDEDDLFLSNSKEGREPALEVEMEVTPATPITEPTPAGGTDEAKPARRKRYLAYDGQWPPEATHVIHWSDCLSFAHFDQEEQKIKVLSGAKIIRDRRTAIMPKVTLKLQDEMIEAGQILDDGEHLVMQVDLPYTVPSAASSFVTTGSSNGWREWVGRDGRRLEELRRK